MFSSNFRSKTKKIVAAVFEKNISVWFWTNLETFSRISPNQEIFFKNPALWLFYLYIPLTSCKKSGKSLQPFLRKLRYQPTNQQFNQLLPRTPILKGLADAGPTNADWSRLINVQSHLGKWLPQSTNYAHCNDFFSVDWVTPQM